MNPDIRRMIFNAVTIGGLAYAALFIPLPFFQGNPLVYFLTGYSSKAVDLGTLVAIWLLMVALCFVFFRYVLVPFAHVSLETVHKALDKSGMIHLAVLGLVISAVLSWNAASQSQLFIPMGLALCSAFMAILLTPSLDRFPPPQLIPVPGRQAANKAERTYAWSFRYDYSSGSTASAQLAQHVRVEADMDEYQRLHDGNLCRQRLPNPGDLQEYLNKGFCNEVTQVASQIRRTTRDKNLCTFVEVLNAAAFVQSSDTIPYKTDEESTGIAEYWRYPLETLVDGCGDCECKTILAAVLFKTLGHEVLVIDMPPKPEESGHMAIAIAGADNFPEGAEFFVYQNRRYFFCEMTSEGMLPGELPAMVAGKEMRVVVV